MSMFCYQCEQTAGGTGCTKVGVCGKDPETAALQDLLVYSLKGIAAYMHRAQQFGAKDSAIDDFVMNALFTTVTNVNFAPEKVADVVRASAGTLASAKTLYEKACSAAGKQPEALAGAAAWAPTSDLAGLIMQGTGVGVAGRIEKLGPDLAGLEELLTYGLKGMAAYVHHAAILGQRDGTIAAYTYEALDYMNGASPDVNDLVGLNLRCGEANLRAMELLDTAHTTTYGHPTPTPVRIEPKAGKAILVSGHDLKDLEELLKQTEGKGINVYTHGEMLPAHGYPGLKKYPHLVGNYGGAWQDQRKEFDAFPGAILMTTNCIQRPADTYKDRIFTGGLVEWPGVTHIAGRDYAPVIEAALAAPGFAEDGSDKTILVGFGHNAVMSVAGAVVDAVKSGAVKHFFLIGGCDGAKSGRNYYTDLAQAVPDDCVILTLACGKFRFNKLEFGDIGGIPRLLDIGQCNDAYSAIQIAVALANAFGTDVNSLPLSLVLSWYEQKACAILLTLLHLGIKNIRIGPSLPAFVSPTVLGVLVESFGLTPTTTADADLAAMLSA
jgi:hydroxylamine reductase